jgi:hypothetical protein
MATPPHRDVGAEPFLQHRRGASCDPRNTANFLMQCAGDGSNPWIKCTGGKTGCLYL